MVPDIIMEDKTKRGLPVKERSIDEKYEAERQRNDTRYGWDWT